MNPWLGGRAAAASGVSGKGAVEGGQSGRRRAASGGPVDGGRGDSPGDSGSTLGFLGERGSRAGGGSGASPGSGPPPDQPTPPPKGLGTPCGHQARVKGKEGEGEQTNPASGTPAGRHVGDTFWGVPSCGFVGLI